MNILFINFLFSSIGIYIFSTFTFFVFPTVLVYFNRNFEDLNWDTGFNLLSDKADAINLTLIALLITFCSYLLSNFIFSGGKILISQRIYFDIEDKKKMISLSKNFIYFLYVAQIISIFLRIRGGYFFHIDVIGKENLSQISTSLFFLEYINYILIGLISIPLLTKYKYKLNNFNNISLYLITILPILATGSRARILPLAVIFIFAYIKNIVCTKKNIFLIFFPILFLMLLIPILDWLRILIGMSTFGLQNLDFDIYLNHLNNFWSSLASGLIRRLDESYSLIFVMNYRETLQKENIDFFEYVNFEGLIPFFARDPFFNEQRLADLMAKYGFREALRFGSSASSPMTFLGELYFFGKEQLVYLGSIFLGIFFSIYDNYFLKNFIFPKNAFIFGFLSNGLLAISTNPIPTTISTLLKQLVFAITVFYLLKSFSLMRELKD